jgi:hypothetical protein
MSIKETEYATLRQEILEHQKMRMSVLSLALTASTALLATGLELNNPYLPLSGLLLVHSARVQIAQIHYSIQRIASYIRVVLEENEADLNWETASYQIRLASVQGRRQIWNVSPLSPIDGMLLLSGVALALTAVVVAWPISYARYMTIVGTLMWSGAWLWYSRRLRELRTMKVDQNEADFWRSLVVSTVKNQEAEISS